MFRWPFFLINNPIENDINKEAKNKKKDYQNINKLQMTIKKAFVIWL